MTDSQNSLEQYLKTGSDVAFEELVKAHGDLVFGVALRSTNSRELSEEITQEVFITLAKKAESIRESHKLPGWLHRTTVFCAANANRKEMNRRKTMKKYVDESEEINVSLDDEPGWQEILPVLDRAISLLPQHDQEALLMRYYEKSSYQKIARFIGKSETACRKKVARALEKLEKSLRKEGVVVTPSVLGVGLNANLQIISPVSSIEITRCAMAAKGLGSSSLMNLIITMKQSKITAISVLALSLVIGGSVYSTQYMATHSLKKKTTDLRLSILKERQEQMSAIKSANLPKSKLTQTVSNDTYAKKVMRERDWNSLSQEMYQAESQQDFAAMLELKKELAQISPTEASSALDKLDSLDLEAGARNVLESYLIKVAGYDHPQAVLDRYRQSLSNGKGRVFARLFNVFSDWMVKDSNAALDWLDSEVTKGTFESKRLDGKNENRLLFEEAIIDHLISSDPALLEERVKNLPIDHLMSVLKKQRFLRLEPGPKKQAFMDLVRQTVPEKRQAEIFEGASN